MALSADANRWAPKLVITLQLATWSVVGILLVRRGSMRLRGSAEDRTSSAEIEMQTITSGRDFERPIEESSPTASTLREYDHAAGWREWDDTREDEVPRRAPKGPRHRVSFSRYRASSTPTVVFEGSATITERTTVGSYDRGIQYLRKTVSKATRKEPSKKRRKVMYDEEAMARKPQTGRAAERADGKPEDVTEPPSKGRSFEGDGGRDATFLWGNGAGTDDDGGANVTAVPGTGSARETGGSSSPPRAGPPSRGGTAAAIVMLAIGIVMLLLGPSIVILRALDARRQRRRQRGRGRRFGGAASADAKDLPPSYEQATLMDQAPRYSTLRLNTLLEPASSSGTVT